MKEKSKAEIDAKKRFDRRSVAAREGRHIPNEEELLRGMQFHGDSLEKDVLMWTERIHRRLVQKSKPAHAELVLRLEELMDTITDMSIRGVEAAARSLEDLSDLTGANVPLRCRIYLAYRGDRDSAFTVAGELAELFWEDNRRDWDPHIGWSALAWTFIASRRNPNDTGEVVYSYTTRSIASKVSNYSSSFQQALTSTAVDEAVGELTLDIEEEEKEAATAPLPETFLAAVVPNGVVVVSGVGSSETSTGKTVTREWDKIAGRPLALAPTPQDLSTIRQRLASEFPHAVSAIDSLLDAIVGRQSVFFLPTLLVGSPGCGKSRFARRLAEELGVPCQLVPCGGISDGALGGTPRQWNSGTPSLPLMIIRQHSCAGPVIILDEIEKIGTSRYNGNFHDVLLGLTERETAQRWQDPYIMAPCDLSHVSWLMTANEPDPIPRPLRDRIRFVKFPDPRHEHLEILARQLLEARYAELGADPRWALPLEGIELEALSDAWPGGSLRVLQRLIDGIVKARDKGHRIQ